MKGLREINFEIPDTCKILNCSRNAITELPEDLKNVEQLICHTNRLTHLPEDLKKEYKRTVKNQLLKAHKLHGAEFDITSPIPSPVYESNTFDMQNA